MRAKRRFRGAEDRVRRAENAVRVAGFDGAEARLRVRQVCDRSDARGRTSPTMRLRREPLVTDATAGTVPYVGLLLRLILLVAESLMQ